MNSDWQEFLGANGARIDGCTISDFGDAQAELAAARDGTVIAPLTHLGLIECSGDDARTFLQNQLTSDVNHLAAHAAQYSAWCSPKGRMLASFVLCRGNLGYLALLSADLQEFVQKRLQMYVLRSKVEITNRTEDCELIGLSGAQAEAALQHAGLPVPSAPMQTEGFAHGTVIRLDALRYIAIVVREMAASVWKNLSLKALPAGTPAWLWLDIREGIPRIAEATKEAFVPQMANIDKIGGVSFHKGCYPGQEIVARTQYLGKVKRHLYRFHSSEPAAAGMPIHTRENPEQPCGVVANAAPAPGGGYDGLAVILEETAAGAALRVGTGELTDIVAVGPPQSEAGNATQ